MTDAYNWGELRAQACARFGDAPGAQLEQRIIDVFAEHPALVAGAVDSVARGYAAGRVHSPWPMLATQCEREAQRAVDARTVVASGSADYEAKLAKAERFIRQVGYICESEDELRAELAERKWPVTDALVELWRELRPIGERLERETIERAEHWKQTRRAMQDSCKRPPPDVESAKTLHTSQPAMPLTSVSVGADADADIAW